MIYFYLGDIMSFDGVFLSKILDEISFLKTGRISKILESGDTDFIFTIRSQGKNHNLMLSFSSLYSRIHLTERLYDSVKNPKSFTMFLRKHIEGYFIEDIKQYNSDRIMIFTLTGYNEMQDLNKKHLICEIMGRYSNMILTDESYKIIESLKHDGVGEYNRTILPGAIYEFPTTNKLNPFDYQKDDLKNIFKNINNPKDLLNTFNGISNTFSIDVFKNDDIINNFYNNIHMDIKPSIIIDSNNKKDFYYNPLSYEVIKSYDSISLLLDDYYFKEDLKSKVKAKTGDLLSFVNKQISKYEKKLIKLDMELADANDSDKYRIYGELLLSSSNLKDKLKEIEVFNYYTSENITIKLDNKYTVLDNSNKYFKKYQKAKSSIKYINEQIEESKNEIDYFNVLKYQLNDASINEALEIQDELIENKYLFNKEITNKKKNPKPKLLTFELDNNILISVGKNNIQNEYLTHKLANSNDMWFHVKDAPGSHVVVHNGGELSEEEIRIAANLAAYYSSFKESSSVPVDYTRIRNIKKIPKRRACFVTYKHQSTIYIDPDYDTILKLKIRK